MKYDNNQDLVSVIMTKREWERYSNCISDILCWCHGFKAAQPEDKQINLWGLKEVGELNVKIKDKIYG